MTRTKRKTRTRWKLRRRRVRTRKGRTRRTMLANPARVMKPQLRVVELAEEDVARYRPLKDVSIGGIVVVKNVSGEPCQIVEPVAVKKSGDKDDDDDSAD